MIASLLSRETLTLHNVPRLSDVRLLMRILGNHGIDAAISGKRLGQSEESGETITLSARDIVDTTAPYELVSRMRASFWVIAPLLARMGEARVSLPGGCAIGTRPVDLLLMALEKLGADIEIDSGYVIAKAPKGLKGGQIDFPKVTVGGTHVALMAASLAEGTTIIDNAAREPEIADLAECLTKMGAKIEGAGTSRIIIEGVPRLDGAHHTVLPDRIETGTYAIAVAMTGGNVLLEGARADLLQNALDACEGRPEPEVSLSTQFSTNSQRVRLTVRDTGTGFPEAILKRAFEPYVTTKPKGTGLGLAVVKKIADEHRARLELKNLDTNGQVQGAQVSLSFQTVASSGKG